MHRQLKAIFSLSAELAFVANVWAADVLFFSGLGACNQNTDWVYCSDVDPFYCCHTDWPFCAELSCNNCVGDTLATFQSIYSCPSQDQANATCTPKSGVNCCMPAGGQSKCAGGIYDPKSERRGAGQDSSSSPSNPTCRTPDGMVYYDSDGIRREIRNMTTETYQKALDLYSSGDVGALNEMVS